MTRRSLVLFALSFIATIPLPAQLASKPDAFSGRRAPGFSLMDINYNQHDLADYRGRVVILDFIRTNCPLCQTFTGVGERIRTRFGDKAVLLTIVNAPPDSLKTVGEFIEKFEVKSPVLFDTFQVAASYLKLTPVNPEFGLPHLFLIDANGQIRHDMEYDGSNDAYFSGEAKPLMDQIEALVNQGQRQGTKPATSKKK